MNNSESLTPTVLSAFSGAMNFAPIKPLLALKDKSSQPKKHYLCDAIKERYAHYTKMDEGVRNEILSVGRTLDNFLNGKQFAVPDFHNGGWLTVQAPNRVQQRQRATSMLGMYKTEFSQRWMRSWPDIVVDAVDDEEDTINAAKAASAEVDHYEQKLITPWFAWQESLLALTWGTYITRVRLDRGVDGVKAIRQLYGESTVTVPGEGDCLACGYMADDSEFAEGVCPACKSPDVTVKPATQQAIQSHQGSEQVNLGDLVLDQLPLPACWWDMATRPELSSWFIYNQRISLGQVREILGGDVRLPESKVEDRGLEVLEALARPGQAVSGHSRQGRQRASSMWAEQATLNEMWLSPSDYAGIIIKGDEETLCGEKLPAGIDMAQAFPNGCIALGMNHMESVIGLYGEKHGPTMASGVYEMRAHSGAGRNAADVIDTQQRINKMNTQFERSADAPSFFYESSTISPEQALQIGRPAKAIPVDLSGIVNVNRINDAVQQLPPTAFAPQFMQYAFEHLPNLLQMQMKTVQFSGALPGVDNKTATGAQIAASLADGLFRPMAEIKGQVRLRNAQQFLEQAQRYFPVERRYPFKGKHGKAQTVTLSKLDLKKLRLKVVENSMLPQNDVIKRIQANEFIGLFGGFQGYLAARQAEPQSVAALERIYDFRLEGNEVVDVAATVTSRRLKQLKQLIGNLQIDPMSALQELQPPVQLGELNHLAKAKYCQEWLDTDDGLDAPMPMRVAVELLARMHYDFETQGAMLMLGAAGAVQAAGMPQGMAQAA